jgi:hypothetical protein
MLLYKVTDLVNVSTNPHLDLQSPRIRYFLAHSPPDLEDYKIASIYNYRIETLAPVVTDLLDKVEDR